MTDCNPKDQKQQPAVSSDPRFRAGRKLIQRGQVHLGAVNIFSLLLGRAKEEFGESSLETSAAGYEYGYALFLDATRDAGDGNCSGLNHTDDVIDERKPSANATYEETINREMSEIERKVEEALEEMVNACTILYEYVNKVKCNTKDANIVTVASGATVTTDESYFLWALEQLSRVLVGIGYVLSHQGNYPDALNSYLNAIPYRAEGLEQSTQKHDRSVNLLEESLDQLKAHRLLVEVYILVVEEILKCPDGKDITTSETNEVLIKDEERIKMAKIYYEKAREELQEV